jgi:phosphatidylglycerophosphate synthase
MTAALLLATSEAAEGGPAALLQADGATLLARLEQELTSLGARPAAVLTRRGWGSAIRAATGAEVIESASVAEDLRRMAAFAGRANGPLLIANADILVHREALAGLLTNPKVATGILVTGSQHRGQRSFRVRAARGRVVAMASGFHRVVHNPNNYFLGVLKVDDADRVALAAASGDLATLLEARPAGWDAELERKAGAWRTEAWRRAVYQQTGQRPAFEELPPLGEMRLDDEAEAELAARVAAAAEDATALAVVGLVRTGTHVGQSHLRGFFWARALSAPGAEAAAADMATIDEDKIALAAAVKSTDGFFTTFFVSPYSRYIARFAARRGLTPNAITTFSMALGVAAALAFAEGSRAGMIAGAVLLQIAFTFDCVDGQLARYTRQFSKLGAWLDSVFDRGKEYVVFAGLAAGAAHGFHQDVWSLAGAALTLQTARHMIDFSFAATRHAAIAAAPRLSLTTVGDRPAPVPVDPEPATDGGAVATLAPPAPPAAPPRVC